MRIWLNSLGNSSPSLNTEEITTTVVLVWLFECTTTHSKNIAKFPQECVRADRQSTLKQSNLTVKEGLFYEWNNSMKNNILSKEGINGAGRFSNGHGRHGDFEDI